MTSVRRRGALVFAAAFAPGLAAAPAPAPAQEDAAEVLAIVRDLAPRAGQVEAPRHIAGDVRFESGSDRLTAAARARLDRIARALRAPALAGLRFRLEGHTDSRGAADYNRDLSLRRARSAAAYLTAAWEVSAARLVVVGHGEDRPRDPANPESGVNRRVEIVTLAPPPPEPAETPSASAPAPERPAGGPAPPGAADGDGDRETFVRDVLTGDGR